MRFWPLPLLALTLAAQTPSFEVASIRLANITLTGSSPCGNTFKLSPDSVLASGIYRLDVLIEDAFRDVVDDFELPQWARNAGSFAISVKIPADTNVEMCNQMLQNLLAERFHLVADVETRNVEYYYVKVAKSGLKLKPVSGPPTDPNAAVTITVNNGLSRFIFRGAPADRVFNSVRGIALSNSRVLSFDANGYSSITNGRSYPVAGVVDETGLTGYYDGEIQFTLLMPSQRNQSPLPESVEDALARQLGLTLELRKTPGKVLVVRSMDRMPTEN